MLISEQVKEILNQTVCYESYQMIGDDQNLFGVDGLGLDSLDYFEIALAIEEQFGINLDDVEPNDVLNVKSLTTIIEKKVLEREQYATTD